jgi:hypothetical protein
LHQMAVDRGVADFSQRRSAEIDGPRRGPVLPEIERIRVLGRGFERSYRLDDGRQIATARPVERRPSERSVGVGLGLA